MSLLLAWITPEEATIAVDTEGVRADGSRVAMSKLFTIAHLPAVLGFRGQAAFSAGVIHAIASRGFDTVDDLLEALPAIVNKADDEIPAYVRVTAAGDIGNEGICAGWSDKQSRMVARTFTKRGDATEFTVRESQGCIAPWDAATMADIPKTADAVKRLAEAQVRYMRGTCGVGGGKLILCRATRESTTVSQVMRFAVEEMAA